jgi:hypothetical protein
MTDRRLVTADRAAHSEAVRGRVTCFQRTMRRTDAPQSNSEGWDVAGEQPGGDVAAPIGVPGPVVAENLIRAVHAACWYS